MLQLPDPIDKVTPVRNINELDQLFRFFCNSTYSTNGMRLNLKYHKLIITFMYYQKVYYAILSIDGVQKHKIQDTTKVEFMKKTKKAIRKYSGVIPGVQTQYKSK